ncbi:MAG: hypothetical protein K6G45_11895, partial [Lachnospiraceae bacterium]|nr:hypothetical protein [Lachnospiraceae bacterium]
MFLQQEEIRPSAELRNFLETLAEADEDVKLGRVAPMKETFDDLRSLLEENKTEVRIIKPESIN